MKWPLCLAALLSVSMPLQALAEEWPKIVEMDAGGALYVKPGSSSIKLDAENYMVFQADAKLVNKDQISMMELLIRVEDCIAEKGVMVTRSIGQDVSGNLPFLFGSGSAASVAAEVLCLGWMKAFKNASESLAQPKAEK